MQFQVPQFIEIEDKIFGPLTLKQFIYLVGGAGLAVIFYLFLPFYLSIFFIIASVAFALALAFYQFNNKPFIFLVEAAVKYILNSRLYIWRKEEVAPKKVLSKIQTPTTTIGMLPKVKNSKLKQMSQSLDTKAGPIMPK